MEFAGERLIAAPRAVVWDRINDPQVMLAAIPGCTSFAGDPETGYQAEASFKLGPFTAHFTGTLRISQAVPPESYHLDGEADGGWLGRASGSSDVRLEEVEGGTLLRYRVTTDLGGRLLSLGSRALGGAAGRVADHFFDRLLGPGSSQP